MTHRDDLESAFPQLRQIGGSHYKNFQHSKTYISPLGGKQI